MSELQSLCDHGPRHSATHFVTRKTVSTVPSGDRILRWHFWFMVAVVYLSGIGLGLVLGR